MSLIQIGLKGDFVQNQNAPKECRCGCKKFYKQTDFNRSFGLTIVGLASVATFILAFQGYPWLITWSPMPMALILDFGLSKTRPLAVLCYKCGLIYRGLQPSEFISVDDFNLEVYDLIQYPERQNLAL